MVKAERLWVTPVFQLQHHSGLLYSGVPCNSRSNPSSSLQPEFLNPRWTHSGCYSQRCFRETKKDSRPWLTIWLFNSLQWKITMLLSSVNLFHMAMLNSQRLNVDGKNTGFLAVWLGHGWLVWKFDEIGYPQMQWTIGWSSNDGKTKLERGSQGEIIDESSLFHILFPWKIWPFSGDPYGPGGPIPASQRPQLPRRVSDSHPWPWTVVEIFVNASHEGKIFRALNIPWMGLMVINGDQWWFIMGISWEYHGNIMGISWEYHGNIMGIRHTLW